MLQHWGIRLTTKMKPVAFLEHPLITLYIWLGLVLLEERNLPYLWTTKIMISLLSYCQSGGLYS